MQNLGYTTYVLKDATLPVDLGDSVVKRGIENFKKIILVLEK